MIKFIFWTSFFILFYIYAGYPLLLFLLTFLKKQRKPAYHDGLPPLTLVIAARNEEKVIAQKLENSISLDYPKDQLQILVMSDQSTDQTNEIVLQYAHKGVTLVALTDRHGKTKAQNTAIQHATGKVIVFSDANAIYAKDALIQLATHFQDKRVDFVSGELCYTNPEDSTVGDKEGLYWRYEKVIKRMEDRLNCITGANGSIYAVKKSSYLDLNFDMISDFMEPLLIAGKGGVVLYEENAKSFEESSTEFDQELKRKRRILSRSFFSLLQHKWLLNPKQTGWLAFQLWSHKIFRWLTPVFMISLFVSNLFLLDNFTFILIFSFQLLLYITAGIAQIWPNEKKLPVFFSVPYYFILLNYASLLGLLDMLKGQNVVFWDPLRK